MGMSKGRLPGGFESAGSDDEARGHLDAEASVTRWTLLLSATLCIACAIGVVVIYEVEGSDVLALVCVLAAAVTGWTAMNALTRLWSIENQRRRHGL